MEVEPYLPPASDTGLARSLQSSILPLTGVLNRDTAVPKQSPAPAVDRLGTLLYLRRGLRFHAEKRRESKSEDI